ncbi:MAG: YgfZ/GcvT domain-containing protein [Rhodanobacteraceae bacterium]
MTAPCPKIANVPCMAIGGADARDFAQAQFSADLDALAPGHWQWNAWLDPQGRVRALMHLADAGDGTLLAVLRGGDAQDLCTALSRYVLRKRVTLAARTFTGRAGDPLPSGMARFDEGIVVLGYGSRSLRLDPSPQPVDPAARMAWRLQDIREGLPHLPAGDHQFLPPALGLEHLGAVAFEKGCYPGQEVAARLHYRGGHKYRMIHLRGAVPLPPGSIALPGGGALRVLDATSDATITDALVVAPLDIPDVINVLDSIYHVISRFDT